MAWAAEPSHIQGLEIVKVVHLAVRRATKQARLLMNKASAMLVDVGVGSAIVLETLNGRERVCRPPHSHVSGVARCAVTMLAMMDSMAFATNTFGHGDLPAVALSSGGPGASNATPPRPF